MEETRTGLRPGLRPRTVRGEDGLLIEVPAGWELLPPGDAAITRATSAMGPVWKVEEKRGRKVFSRGLWAPAAHIAAARAAVDAQRADPAHQRKLDASRKRRAEAQAEYVDEFEGEVLDFLAFHPRHAALAQQLAAQVTAHATPVGSGTVARTERIPVERRAEAAVIAWMRHQTTAYDQMTVERVKGARRELRRALAERSRALLDRYRRGEDPPPHCPLARALDASPAPVSAPASAPPRPAPPRPSLAAAPPRSPTPPRPLPPRPPLDLPAPRPPTAAPVRPAPPPAPPVPPPPGLPAPRNAEEEAQQARYLAVRARMMRKR